MTLEEVAIHYQKTGEFLPVGYEFMMDYLIDNIQGMFDEYTTEYSEDSVPFDVHMLSRLNDWQIENGFARDYTQDEIEEMMEDDIEIDTGDDDDEGSWLN